MSFKEEFKAFVMKGNVVDLAVAVVIGGAFGKIVTALVEGVIMPLVGMAVPGGDWRSIAVGPQNAFKVGHVAGAIVDFLCIALVVFLVFVKGLSKLKKHEDTPLVAATTKDCPRCLEAVPLKATRCKHCTSELA
ncbi:MAG TPA: large conductance mechanosensitive channel protein MscL [Holophagaceae bacterium]|nr:large conductance mechanosensitive channel protein MscL [Holophagaceae bacterium]